MKPEDFSNLNTDEDSCFLCGSDDGDITLEHVFPKWLQQRHNLWDEKLNLLNGSRIPYRSLTIPCCRSCNSGPLACMEEKVASAVRQGYGASKNLGRRSWYLWIAKIYFGILRKELALFHDRSLPQAGTILAPEAVALFSNLHVFLQGIRRRHEFAGNSPYSVLICNLHDLGAGLNFWFADNPHYLTAAIRMGEVGVIVAFEDAGINAASFGRYLEKVNGRKLHPIQFHELYAKVLYQTQLMNTSIKYLTSQLTNGDTPMRTNVFWAGGLREWVPEEFSRVLRFYVGDWLESRGSVVRWYAPPDRVPTWMVDPEGEILVKERSEWEGAR